MPCRLLKDMTRRFCRRWGVRDSKSDVSLLVFAPLGACLCFLPGRVEAGELGQSALEADLGLAKLLKTPEMSFWGWDAAMGWERFPRGSLHPGFLHLTPTRPPQETGTWSLRQPLPSPHTHCKGRPKEAHRVCWTKGILLLTWFFGHLGVLSMGGFLGTSSLRVIWQLCHSATGSGVVRAIGSPGDGSGGWEVQKQEVTV